MYVCSSIPRVCIHIFFIICINTFKNRINYLTSYLFRSATVDSDLFSRYFGNCPVITAEGRTHPVTTYYLEDIYESIDYRIASDSPASLGYGPLTKEKVTQKLHSSLSCCSVLY